VEDFTSSLYLGLRHPSERLRGWRSLTTGVPAAVRPAAGTRALEGRVAALYGSESASLATSTLHAVWDLFGQLADAPVALYVDSGAYVTLRWGVERAAGRGVPVREFPHHDVAELARIVAATPPGRAAVVVTDGLCPRCGRCAPLADYLALGRVVIDDSQAVGVIGAEGGGTPRQLGIADRSLVAVASFAKAFGAPLAAVLGSAATVASFVVASECRVHSSPPSVAALRALDRALRVNARAGDDLRAKLDERVNRFRAGLSACGLAADGGRFPVQAVRGVDPLQAHETLLRAGIRTVLRAGDRGPELCFVITARHSPAAIDNAVAALAGLRAHA
jgi:8-amino-7-oxononanoate synthase